MGGTDSHKNADMRSLLGPLADLAAKYGAAIVGVSHLSKGGSPEALLRVNGSLAFVAAARAVYLVSRDKEDVNKRFFLPMKNNLGTDRGGLSFEIEPVKLERGIETSRVRWDSAPVTMTADEAMAPEALRAPEEAGADATAKQFLLDVLGDGTVASKDVQKQAREAGIALITLRRAREYLGIKPRKNGMDGEWDWRLPTPLEPTEAPKVLIEDEDAHTK